jgi:hypothetical protein
MDNRIPKNTPEIPVSGVLGKIMMVRLGRKTVKRRFCAGIGVVLRQIVMKGPFDPLWEGAGVDGMGS